jgi:hypothetical protein
MLCYVMSDVIQVLMSDVISILIDVMSKVVRSDTFI